MRIAIEIRKEKGIRDGLKFIISNLNHDSNEVKKKSALVINEAIQTHSSEEVSNEESLIMKDFLN
ncbi:hypothetical protein Glove_165g128 [Diversispora epigaea]|uniref:Uncharacterized protein n=1 Tax=Diversispora epigaea TaxID=1348612 RepID=A0A397J0D6_9GLOM|nr:hypothetical protein Glove_165g128 [Diversispora epigaea]